MIAGGLESGSGVQSPTRTVSSSGSDKVDSPPIIPIHQQPQQHTEMILLQNLKCNFFEMQKHES